QGRKKEIDGKKAEPHGKITAQCLRPEDMRYPGNDPVKSRRQEGNDDPVFAHYDLLKIEMGQSPVGFLIHRSAYIESCHLTIGKGEQQGEAETEDQPVFRKQQLAEAQEQEMNLALMYYGSRISRDPGGSTSRRALAQDTRE